ncbi:prepilin-type N-terminal cleavage/methylation domain-containing protein [bacterium]|uniref:Type II secretion system protein GspG C-terminal domain-containing protein n=1 Tax=candidate division WWE3 bacterium CG_4_9_14_3_um_filter_39_7 TaxID=1975080 RepID=A0A2M7X2W3_UNCKA|nr:prepilin-type N-terminal cleavage/methylation domain-containing protein [bacterium]PJA40331.1 MAG: hypothetical protein CO179_02555 [candidate division WWE3 bacterium CG_4_9_14_3_um_filter_39_7]
MLSKLSNEQSSGFTLIELLVVIVIIGILSTLGISSYTGAVEGARDTKRLSDITEIETALQRYFLKEGHYPGSADGVPNQGQQIGAGDTIDTLLAPYLTEVPQDPQHDGVLYFYSYDPKHCVDSVQGACDCAGGVISMTLAINKFEHITSPRKDVCSGGNQNQNNADYNKEFFPSPN